MCEDRRVVPWVVGRRSPSSFLGVKRHAIRVRVLGLVVPLTTRIGREHAAGTTTPEHPMPPESPPPSWRDDPERAWREGYLLEWRKAADYVNAELPPDVAAKVWRAVENNAGYPEPTGADDPWEEGRFFAAEEMAEWFCPLVFWTGRAGRTQRRHGAYERQRPPRTGRLVAPRCAREGHGRPRQANAPPSDDPDPAPAPGVSPRRRPTTAAGTASP
jgi:hypothetical protein